MLPKTQQTFLEQEYYLPILAETFLTARKAEGLSRGSLKYYREKITSFVSRCETQAVTQIGQVTPDVLRHFLLAMSERHNAGGVHGISGTEATNATSLMEIDNAERRTDCKTASLC